MHSVQVYTEADVCVFARVRNSSVKLHNNQLGEALPWRDQSPISISIGPTK